MSTYITTDGRFFVAMTDRFACMFDMLTGEAWGGSLDWFLTVIVTERARRADHANQNSR